jgi:hypothetical protein
VNDVSNDRREASARAVKAIGVGIGLFVVGTILTLSPLVWGGRFPYNKYFVIVGLILALLGASMLFNGGFDWIRLKRKS